MPDRLAPTRQARAALGRGSRATDGVPANGRVADPPARLEPASTSAVVTRAIFGPGDLREGGTAAAVLLLLVFALDLTLWLAIPLAVATYAGVALLRPLREPIEAPADASPEQPTDPSEDTSTIDSPGSVEALEPDAAARLAVARFGLTRREIEILPLLAQRLTDREIAERLCISPRTAMNHTASILAKLGLDSRREVAAFAAEHGLLPLAAPPRAGE